MANGQGLVERARKHLGEEYKFVTVPKDDPNWRGPWDCAEFVSWLVYQEASVLYGCDDDKGDPHKADAWTGHWKRDADTRGIRVSVEKAAATAGGILLRFPPDVPGKFGHIVLADGHGGTIEAMGRAYGVKAGKVAGRVWDVGILLPEISYDGVDATVATPGPSHLFALNAPNMDPSIVKAIQRALKTLGFDPGEIDGQFGEQTMKAVVAFQNMKGLVVDGEVGSETAGLLGVDLTAAPQAPISTPAPQPETVGLDPGLGPFIAANGNIVGNVLGGNAMGPLIPIALQLLPGLINLIAGDKTGNLGSIIGKTVSDIAGTTDPAAAKQKLAADPALAAQLQLKLAEIAADQEQKRSEAALATLKAQQDQQIAVLKAQMDQEAARRQGDLDSFKASVQDVADARQHAYEAMKSGSGLLAPSFIISVLVIAAFVAVFTLLVAGKITFDASNNNLFALVNLTLGALVAAFTTVVSFWLGSSQGSRLKDDASVDLQAAQARQANEAMKTAADAVEKSRASLDTARQQQAAPVIISAPAGQTAPSKTSNFRTCVDLVLGQEGGFVNDPRDSGGATNFGITLETLDAWRKQRGGTGATVDDVRNLARDDACEIYRTNYWNVLRCDDLPRGVDLITFDMGVISGAGRAAKILQEACGAASDGSVGAATVAAVKAIAPQEAIGRITQKRLEFLQGLPSFSTFGRGWTNRVNAIEKAATAMADAAGRPAAVA